MADMHHVTIRALKPLERQAQAEGHSELAESLRTVLDQEHRRISRAMAGLQTVCSELEAAGCAVAVMKTLDHWPDFGSDLDLIVTGDETQVVQVLKHVLRGRRCMLTMADHIAHKRCFALPGLPEQVEVHVNRLGHAGEHSKLAERFIARRVAAHFGEYTFQVPAPEEQVIAAALQRMYRHLYVRICDICNTARLMDGQQLDYAELHVAAKQAGVWPGVATYLAIVSDYVERYRAPNWNFPAEVIAAARFGADSLSVRGSFFRFPFLPHGLGLYATQLKDTALGGEVPSIARLSLIPPLASMGALASMLVGSSERVW